MSDPSDLSDLLDGQASSTDGTGPEPPPSGPSCPECGETFAGPAMVSASALYRHLSREHDWDDEQLIEFRRSRGVRISKPKATKVRPDAVVNRGRSRKDAPPRAPKASELERQLAETVKVAQLIQTKLNPALLNLAMMAGAAPFALCELEGSFPAITLRTDRPTELGKMLTLDAVEAHVYAFAYVSSKESWWADKLKDLLPKLAPPLAALGVAVVTYRYGQRVKLAMESQPMKQANAMWEEIKRKAAEAQAQAQPQAQEEG